jgi:tetratricopeptide (TPR) repeat protein
VPARNQQGIALLQKAIALDPQFALGYAVLAHRLVFKGNVEGRTEYLRGVEAGRNAVRIDPYLARGHYGLALALNRTGRVEDARLSMQRAIELDGSSAQAMWDLGFLELNAGRLDQATYWTMRAWPLAPNVPTSWYHLALSLIFLDPALAERWVDAGLARFKSDNPSSVVRLVMQRGILALRRGDHAAAVAQVRDAVRLSPDYYGARSLLAELATYAGTADAEALVDAAVKESPSGRGWWQAYTPRTLRAYLYMRGGRPDRARPLLEAVLDINQKAIDDGDRSGKPWEENVAVHAMLGDREAALNAWERAVEIGFFEAKIDVYDALIAPVKDDPRFIAALDRVRRRTAEMRGRVDLTIIDEWIARGAPTTAVR